MRRRLECADTLLAVRATAADATGPRPDSGKSFKWTIRVYYEDTDAGGVVYYANYLKFFERCRTEWLRALGVDQSALGREQGLQFVVVRAEVEYLQPARLDDDLAIEARVAELGHCSIVFDQTVLRGGTLLARARIRVACVDTQRRQPARLPQRLRSQILSPP